MTQIPGNKRSSRVEPIGIPWFRRGQGRPSHPRGTLNPIDGARTPAIMSPCWYPAPTMAGYISPSSIVIREPAPWLVGDPGPTKRIVPGPAPGSKGNPARITMRTPDYSKSWNRIPGAILVQFCGIPTALIGKGSIDSTARQEIVTLCIPAVPIVWFIIGPKIVSVWVAT